MQEVSQAASVVVQTDLFGGTAPVVASPKSAKSAAPARIIPGPTVGRMTLNRLYIELWFVKEIVVKQFYRMFDDEALEPSDCPSVQFMLSDLSPANIEDDAKILEVVDRYSPDFIDRLLGNDASKRLAGLKHVDSWGKPFGEQSPEEYIQAVEHCRYEWAAKYFALYESGAADAEAKNQVRNALLAISPWNCPARLHPVEAFLRLVPECITVDLLNSFFDWRRKGETLRNVTKNEKRRQQRAEAAAEREAAKAANPKPQYRSSAPTWEELGVKVGVGEWNSTWKKRQALRNPDQVFKPEPLPIVRPTEWVEPTPIAERKVETAGQSDYFLLREYEGRVFDIQYRCVADDGRDVLIDNLAVEGAGGDWNRTRVVGVLRSKLRDPLLGLETSVFPKELLKFDREGVEVYIPEEELRSEVERALDTVVAADNGKGLSSTWATAA